MEFMVWTVLLFLAICLSFNLFNNVVVVTSKHFLFLGDCFSLWNDLMLQIVVDEVEGLFEVC